MNRFEQRSVSAYNKKAADYENTFDGKFTAKFKTMLLESVNIQKGDSVLDVACGNGRLLHMFADRYVFNGYGTDISDKMIEQAKKLCPSMEFTTASCENLPFTDKTFNVIIVCAAYHHFPDVVSFSNEVYRLLKPSGLIYIADVYYPTIVRILCNPFVPLSKAGDVKFYSPGEIKKTLRSAGFQKESHTISGHIQTVSACKV